MGSKFEIVPIVQLKSGLFFKGTVVGEARKVDLTDKKSGRPYSKYVHEFKLLDCSEALTFTAKQDDGSYGEVVPTENTKVSVWATKSLHEKLEMFPEGTILKISEDGEEAAGKDFKRRKFIVKMEKA